VLGYKKSLLNNFIFFKEFFFKYLHKYMNEKKRSKKVVQELREACPVIFFFTKSGLSFLLHLMISYKL